MNFEELVSLCQQTHTETQRRAVRAVDLSLVVRNRLFGRYIVEFEQNGSDRAVYGARLLDSLGARLKPLGIKGVSATRLKLYRSFYRVWHEIRPTRSDQSTAMQLPPIRPTPSDELHASLLAGANTALMDRLASYFNLGWSHYVELLMLDNPDERRFYLPSKEELKAQVEQLTRALEKEPRP